MARHFTLGNGSFLLCLDKCAQIRDLYYPYVGQENHLNGNAHRFGVWADSKFCWFESDAWEKKISYKKETLVTNVEGVNKKLELEITLNDTIHHEKRYLSKKDKS